MSGSWHRAALDKMGWHGGITGTELVAVRMAAEIPAAEAERMMTQIGGINATLVEVLE
jgi:hypothetical protein